MRAADDRDLRLVGEGLGQSVGGENRDAVAQHVDEKCRRDRRAADSRRPRASLRTGTKSRTGLRADARRAACQALAFAAA